MIKCYSQTANYETRFTNGRHTANCDAPVDKGGGGAGFRPLELLEAGLAGCLNIWLRMYAAHHQIPLAGITTEVSVHRPDPGEAIFAYTIELSGDLAEDQRAALLQAAETCPVHQTLAGRVSFQSSSGSAKD